MKFTDNQLHPKVQAGIDACQYIECTPIQTAVIPHILAGQDIAGLAQTGTGKTAAFVIPLMDRIIRSKEAVLQIQATQGPVVDLSEQVVTATGDAADGEADVASEETTPDARPIFQQWKATNFVLVLVPTRELAEQVHENVKKLGGPAGMKSVAIYGGTSYEHQTKAVADGLDFIVATPGRLIDLYKEHQVDLAQVRAVVFDEADRMFDMGFKDDMKYILKRIPNDRQFLVFSATLNFDVLNTAYEFGANPIEVNVSKDQTKAENVQDEIFHVGQDDKNKYLLSILKKYKPKQAIIFSNFKHEVAWLAQFLTKNGFPAMGISSLISQNQRTRIMEQFRNENNSNILVATDVAARGLDVKGVDMVVNFQLPEDAENYVHRIGRTGRAGEKGRAFSLVSDRDVEALQRIETYLENKITQGWLEDSELVTDIQAVRDESRHERRPRPEHGGRGGGKSFSGGRKDFRGGGDRSRGPARDDGTWRPGQPSSAAKNADQAQPRKEFHSQEYRPPRREAGHSASGEWRPNRDNRSQDQQGQKKGGQHPHHKGGSQGPHKHKHENRPRHGGPKGSSGRPQHSYKHRPGQKPASQSAAGSSGVVQSVKGFFKKLFG